MSKYSYEVGSTIETMSNVKVYGTDTLSDWDRVEPRGLGVEPFSVYRVATSGLEYGDGYPRVTWTFDVICQAQLDALLNLLGEAQSAVVYIRTRNTDRTYSYYKAIMHRPRPGEEMTPSYNNHWRDVSLRFTRLEDQTV